MTVSNTFRVDVRPYSGYNDPSLPVASWIAQGGSVGDASGGVVIQNFFFKLDDDAQISELFNLEQIAADTSTSSGVNGTLEILQMDSLAPNRLVSNRVWAFGVTAVGSPQGVSAIFLDRITMLPLWLGAPNRAEGDAGIRIRYPNTDLLLYQTTLQGYMWGPRSVLAEGGPRRPVGGLFGP